MKTKAQRILCIMLICISFLLTSCGEQVPQDTQDDHNHLSGSSILSEFNDENNNSDLTIACYMQGSMCLEVIESFEKKYNVNVKIISYPENKFYALDTKLMARDTDIDLFTTGTLDFYKYIQSGYYTDLSTYESLKTRIESNSYTKRACEFNGTYYGIPQFPNVLSYTDTIRTYLMRNLHLGDGVYDDPNGDELYEVLKHLSQLSVVDDGFDNTFYEGSYTTIVDEYLVLSPYSQNKDLAVLLLEMMFDYINGDISLEDAKGNPITFFRPYPNGEDLSDAHLSWDYFNQETKKYIYDVYDQVVGSAFTDDELKVLARKAAGRVSMRLEG